MQSEKKILCRVMGGFEHTLLSTPFFFSWKKPTLWFYIPFVSYKSSRSLCPKHRAKKKTWASCSTLSFRLLGEKC